MSRSSSSKRSRLARLEPCCGCCRKHRGQIAVKRIDSCGGSAARIQRARWMRVVSTVTWRLPKWQDRQDYSCRLQPPMRRILYFRDGATPDVSDVGAADGSGIEPIDDRAAFRVVDRPKLIARQTVSNDFAVRIQQAEQRTSRMAQLQAEVPALRALRQEGNGVHCAVGHIQWRASGYSSSECFRPCSCKSTLARIR
jgi:hypothetical protein